MFKPVGPDFRRDIPDDIAENLKNLEATLSISLEELDLLPAFRNSEFLQAFFVNVPDIKDQKAYIENTSAYLHHTNGGTFDPNYVLYFRRTLQNDEFVNPKPEEHWTPEFSIVYTGLRNELADGPHRWHSIIKCTTLHELQSVGVSTNSSRGGFTDHEFKIKDVPFNRTLFSFKSKIDQKKLEIYLRQPDAVTSNDIINLFRQRNNRRAIPIPLPPSPSPNHIVDDVW